MERTLREKIEDKKYDLIGRSRHMKQKKDYVLGWIPKYAIIPLISALALNMLVYSGSMVLCKNFYHHDFTTAFDRMVPVIPEFTSIYLICYVFWVVNYIMIAGIGKEHMYRFLVGDFMSRIVCGIFFVFLPTTLVRPEITGTGFWDQALRLVYSIDQSANLFPSIHCLVSWFCYIGIRHQKKIPIWYQRFSCIFAILVCISTQVTKQHYIIDVFGGIILSEVCYLIGRKTKLYQGLWKVFEKINCFVGLEDKKIKHMRKLSEIKG